jgi:GAF domain
LVAAKTLDRLAVGGDPVMVSCGAAVGAPGVKTPAQLLKAADAALYRAKRNGGGQLFTAGRRSVDSGQWSDRRALRRSTPERVRAAVREIYHDLEERLAEAEAVDRIEAVAMTLAGALNAAAWAVSFAPAGSGFLRTVSMSDDRDQRLQGLRLEVGNDVYALCEYPATARLVEAGSGAWTLDRDDEAADSAECALLDTYGRQGMLAAAAAAHDGTWLLELYSDAATALLDEALVETALLMRAAVPPLPAGRDRVRLVERRTAQLRLTGGLGLRLAGARSESAVVRTIVTELQRGLEADAVGVMRLTEDGQAEAVAGAGLLAGDDALAFSTPPGRGLIGRALREGRTVSAPDVREEPDYYPTPSTSGILSELDVPVQGPAGLWGVISIQAARTQAFDEEDVRLVEIVAAQMAAALTYLH